MPTERTGSAPLLLTALVCEGGLGLLAWGLGLLLSRPPLTQIRCSLEAVYWGLAATAPLLLLLVAMTRWPQLHLIDVRMLLIVSTSRLYCRCPCRKKREHAPAGIISEECARLFGGMNCAQHTTLL